MDLKRLKFKKEDIVFLASLICIFFIQMYKARLGTGSNDEHFYISLGYRFYQGDALFYDDWHIAQMIGFFITPVVYLFRLIHGNNDGIVLGFRYTYILFTLFIGLCIYLKFRKEYRYYAVVASSVYMLFTPFQIMSLSYNTMSVGFLLLALLCYKRHHILRIFLAGILYGCAVINTPYLALAYVFILFMTIKHKDIFNVKDCVSISLGIAFTAISFLVFVFTRTSLTNVLNSLQYLVDPSHSTSIPKLFAINGYRLIHAYGIAFIAFVFELIYALINRKNYQEKKVLEVTYLITTLMIVYASLIHPTDISIGGFIYILLPIYICGLIHLLLMKENSYLKLCFGVSSFHAFLLSISSNVGPRSYLGPLITAIVITILVIQKDKQNLVWNKMTITCFTAFLLFFKLTSVYGGSGDYSVKIESGPLKGLYDSEEIVSKYQKNLEDIEYINTLDKDYIRCISYSTWEYLASDKKCGTNSTYIYFWYKEQYQNACDTYAKEHSDKKAWIYLDEQSLPFGITEDDSWMKQFTKVKQLNGGVLFEN